jgi:CheY-like chemotaxis protein
MQDRAKILLVESSLFFMTMEKQFLSRMPLTILEAASASDALEICRSNQPGLIYLSSELKDMSGAECCREIKADPELKAIPIIIICNEKETTHSEIIRNSGCDAVLQKPLDKNRFLEIGRSFLAGFRENRRPCLITVRIRQGESIFAAKALDISSGGLFLKSSEAHPVGTLFELDMNLARPGEVGPRITCTGRLSWHNTAANPTKPHHPVGYGIKFIDLPESTRNILYGFLRTLDGTL